MAKGGTYKQFKTDENREKSGIILDIADSGKFRLARAGGANQKYQRVLMAKSKPYRRAIQAGTIDQATADKILAEAYAESVLLGWEDVTGEDGETLPFSRDNAVKLFTDLPDLFAEVQKAATDSALFREEILEGDSKNS